MKYATKGYWATQRYKQKGSKNVNALKNLKWVIVTDSQKRLCAACGGYTWSGDEIYKYGNRSAHILCINNLREAAA